MSVSGTVETRGLFPGTTWLHGQSDKPIQRPPFVTTRRPWNINQVPIAYAFQPRLRGRLTLRGLALRRNPWTFGESVSHTLCRYSCQHSHFWSLHRLPYGPASSIDPSSDRASLLQAMQSRSADLGHRTLRYQKDISRQRKRLEQVKPKSSTLPTDVSLRDFGVWSEPRHIFAARHLI